MTKTNNVGYTVKHNKVEENNQQCKSSNS